MADHKCGLCGAPDGKTIYRDPDAWNRFVIDNGNGTYTRFPDKRVFGTVASAGKAYLYAEAEAVTLHHTRAYNGPITSSRCDFCVQRSQRVGYHRPHGRATVRRPKPTKEGQASLFDLMSAEDDLFT